MSFQIGDVLPITPTDDAMTFLVLDFLPRLKRIANRAGIPR